MMEGDPLPKGGSFSELIRDGQLPGVLRVRRIRWVGGQP